VVFFFSRKGANNGDDGDAMVEGEDGKISIILN
jgi:hypothetical protein